MIGIYDVNDMRRNIPLTFGVTGSESEEGGTEIDLASVSVRAGTELL